MVFVACGLFWQAINDNTMQSCGGVTSTHHGGNSCTIMSTSSMLSVLFILQWVCHMQFLQDMYHHCQALPLKQHITMLSCCQRPLPKHPLGMSRAAAKWSMPISILAQIKCTCKTTSLPYPPMALTDEEDAIIKASW